MSTDGRRGTIGFDARRIIVGTLIALFVSTAWLTRAYTDFTPLRFKVVETPIAAASGRVTVTTAAFPDVRTLPPASAVIARIKTDAAPSTSLTIAIDGRDICRRSLGGPGSHRVDCASNAAWDASGEHSVSVSLEGAWSLEYLELATHHGNSFGFNTFFVVPSEASHQHAPTLMSTFALGLVVFALFQYKPSYPRARSLRWVGRGVIGLVTVLAIVIVTSPWVSNYLVLLSTGTFLRWLTVALAPRVWTWGRWLLSGRGHAFSYARVVVVATTVAVVMSVPVRWWLNGPYQHNYSGFLAIPQSHFDANPLLNQRDDIRRSLILLDHGGYDGQFMYFAVFDPLLQAFKDQPQIYGRIFDQAPYRYGRVGFPLLARLLSLGDWRRVPATLIWMVVGGLFALAAVVAWTAERRGLSAGVGALVLCVPGFWFSVQSGLPEPIAGALLVGALVSLSFDRARGAAVLFAASLLVRETGMIAVGAATLALLYQRRTRAAIELAVISVTPLLAWRIYSGVILYPDWGSRAFLFSAPSGTPFAGIMTMWSLIAKGQYRPEFPSFAIAGITFPLLLLAALILFVAMLRKAPSVAALAGVLYTASALTLRYDMVWLHVGNAERTTYEVFLMLVVAALHIRSYPRWLRRSLVVFWIAAGVYVLWGGYDSPHIRETLWPERLA